MIQTQFLPFLCIDAPVELMPHVRILWRPIKDEDFSVMSFGFGYLRKWLGKSPFGRPTAVLEVATVDEGMLAALCAMVDLCLGRWQFLHEEAHWVRTSIPHNRAPPIARQFNLTPRRLGHLRHLATWLSPSRKGTAQLRSVAARRWHAAVSTGVAIDSILHGTAALEAMLLTSTGDMRLRLAVRAAGAVPPSARAEVFSQVYRSYALRSEYAHGRTIPKLTKREQFAFLSALTRIFVERTKTDAVSVEDLERIVIPWIPVAGVKA